jgi:spoIIIJ-associated protein
MEEETEYEPPAGALPEKPESYPEEEAVRAPRSEPAGRAEAVDRVESTARVEPARTVVEAAGRGEEEHDLMVARETVSDLLERMNVHAQVSSHFGEADEERSRVPIMVDVRGDDLGILIGRRAEVLNALQYISGLMVSKELGRSISLVIDVEGYRSRREGQLRQLARRMADQAMKTGRRQVLEPMTASERRIIHMELRDHPSVKTESIGEDPRRKVTIIPKE